MIRPRTPTSLQALPVTMVTNLHGKSISISSVCQLNDLNIERGNFLSSKLREQVSARVNSGNEILFLGNDVAEPIKREDYNLVIHGILPCGSKTSLTITGIEPYVDVKLRDDESDKDATSRVKSFVAMAGAELELIKIRFNSGNVFLYYDHRVSRFARVHFRTLKARTDFLNVCRDNNVRTYSNDKSTYYRVVARNYELNLSGWSILRNYKKVFASSSKSEYSLTVDINDIESVRDDKQLGEIASSQGFDPSITKYENMILAGFDIEMIPAKPDRFPDADKNPKDSIFMICITFHMVKRKDAILSVCLTLKKADVLDDVLMIHCTSEGCLLSAFARVMSFIQPDFITEFNGGGFDWRNIITKSRYCGVLPSFLEDMSIVRLQQWEKSTSMLTRFHREGRIKINGATADAIPKGLKMQGFVPFDLLIVFKQLEPNADSHKLNECLKRCNLGSKDDLDVKEMFRIYREGTSSEMKLVAHYCFIDTFKLQQLQIKKNIVQDRREVANLSYTSLNDNFCYAGGSRMRNLLMNRGARFGYFFDTEYRPKIEDPTAKFPGAYVVPPLKGVVKPMMRLEEFCGERLDENELANGLKFIGDHFSEIYESKTVPAETPETIRDYIEYVLTAQNHYPISGLDFASLYPSIIMTYNISPEKLIIDEGYANEVRAMGKNLQFVSFPFCGKIMKAWFVRHENVEQDYSVCGKLLIELFARRAALKKELRHYGELISEMEEELKPFSERDAQDEYPRMDELNEAIFDHASIDSKQKAVKIFMNTLYGEMGNFISCICAVQVSGSVTTMGRHNLKLAKKFVEDELRMTTYYGDSVVGDTPIMIKRVRDDGTAQNDLIPIKQLDDCYVSYVGGKSCVDYTHKNVHVMTENGYTKILKVIRHRTSKKLYRVTTHVGSVIVTEDHSLLNANKQKIKPRDCVVGTELLHWNSPAISFNEMFTRMNVDNDASLDNIVSVMGFFFSNGRCGQYPTSNGGTKLAFTMSHRDIAPLRECCDILNANYRNAQLKIVEPTKSSGEYKAVAIGNISTLVTEWSDEFYSSRRYKKVPKFVLNGNRETKLAFMQGYYRADGVNELSRLSTKGQIGTQGLFLLLQDLGYSVSTSVSSDNPSIYHLTFTKGTQRCDSSTAIKSIEELGACDGYVYDLETESHHFAAGVGRLVVHNTDSLYVACNPAKFAESDRAYFAGEIDKIEYGTRLVKTTFDEIEIVKHQVNDHLIDDNGSKFLKMAYEEVLYPCAFLSKKKYYGVAHEEKVDFYPRSLFLRGLEIVKRGSSGVLKDVINKVLWEVMDIKNNRELMDIVKEAISRVFTIEWDIDAFAKTKVYRPDKNNISVLTMMRRYQDINYHTIPEPNVRFKYVICKYYPWAYDIQGRQTKNKIGDCMELVERVREEGLEIDLEYYFDNELTGQFARLITFCDEFKDVNVDLEEPDTTGMDEIELEATQKALYQRTEDALFKAAKKYIGMLAKKYSNSYVNRGSLFVNTWREVCKVIAARPDTRGKRSVAIAKALTMFHSSNGTIHDGLMDWISSHVAKEYRISLTSAQKTIINRHVDTIDVYVRREKIADALLNGPTLWKQNVVRFIREEYDYDYIIKRNLPYDTVWDVVTKDELETILEYENMIPTITKDQAMTIIDMVTVAISTTLTAKQIIIE